MRIRVKATGRVFDHAGWLGLNWIRAWADGGYYHWFITEVDVLSLTGA